MASCNLSLSGYTYSAGDQGYIINTYVTIKEVTTSGSSRKIRLTVSVRAADYDGSRSGKFTVQCPDSNTSITNQSYSCPGKNSTAYTIFDEEFIVYMNSDGKTASIDFSFSADFYSSTAGASRSISGTITTLTLTESSYKLTISAGSGSVITVTRNGEALYNGSSIASGDVLTINFGALDGYVLEKHTVNGSTVSSGSRHTVKGNTTVVATAVQKTHLLSITSDSNIIVNVYDEISGQYYSDGDYISHSSSVTIWCTVLNGFEFGSLIINNTSYPNGISFDVLSPINIVATSSALGLIHIYNGSMFDSYQIFIYDGFEWDIYCPYVYDGDWDICS